MAWVSGGGCWARHERALQSRASGSVSLSCQAMESRNKQHGDSKQTTVKRDAVPNMEDSPPVSDSDVSVWGSRGLRGSGKSPPSPGASVSESPGTVPAALRHTRRPVPGPRDGQEGLRRPLVALQEQQESVRAVPEQSAAPLLDIFSSMLKDTTSQHRAHLFDLNCKICTGERGLGRETSELRLHWLLFEVAVLLMALVPDPRETS